MLDKPKSASGQPQQENILAAHLEYLHSEEFADRMRHEERELLAHENDFLNVGDER